MSKTFETGHAKNVANFEKLIGLCKGYGATYNPAAAGQQLPALGNLYDQAKDVMTLFNRGKTQSDNAINTRADVFDDNRTFATRVVNALRSTDASERTIEDIEGINRKIQGTRATRIKENKEETQTEGQEETGGNTISVSQRSYDSILAHYNKLYEALAAEPLYTPNEQDLSLAGLKVKISNMTRANSNVIETDTDLKNIRIKRDKILYDEKNGLIVIAQKIKTYVKSLYGADSTEATQVKGLEFNKPRK